jgi:hypothetical protein
MSSFPPTALAQINGAIQQGRGAAASVLGQTYTVYRLTDQNNSTTNAPPVLTDFPLYFRPAKKISIENEKFTLLAMQGTCNNNYLKLQDILIETGYENDEGVWCFAQARPTQPSIFMRVEQTCSITRPIPKGGAEVQMPASGAIAGPGYAGIPKQYEYVLNLTNGLYSFEPNTATPAAVYCGLQPLNKVRDGSSLGTPTDVSRNKFLVYMPNLPGELLDFEDRINMMNQDRYKIDEVFNTDLTGLSGYVLIVEKMGV